MSVAQLRRRAGEKGSILVMTAVSLTALMGITALAVDASMLFDMRHRIEAAADAGAMAAALEYKRNTGATCCGSSSNLYTFAKHDIELQSFTVSTDFSSPNGSMIVRHCTDAAATCDASHNSDYYIEVVLTRTVPTFFMRLFGRSSLPVSARAVAGLGRSPYCLVSLATTKKEGSVDQTKDALKIEDDSDVDAPGCYVQVNSAFTGKAGEGALKLGKNASLDTSPDGKISVVGDSIMGAGSTWSPAPTNGAPPIVDPLLTLGTPSSSPCSPGTNYKTGKDKTVSLPGGCYNGIEVEEGATLNLTTGATYVLTADFKTKDNKDKPNYINGSEVLIYTTADNKVEIKPYATVTLSAQKSGDYAGVLFYGARTGKKITAKFDENAEFDLKGAVYYPNGDIEFGNKKKSGTPVNTDCAIFIGRKIKFKKRADMVNSCSDYNASPLKSISVAEDP
jgi:hypothetical protein